MAVTSTIEYCTDRQVQDVYSIASFDTKRRIYNWVASGTSSEWYAYNVGLVTVLFENGVDLGSPQASESDVNQQVEWARGPNESMLPTLEICRYASYLGHPLEKLLANWIPQ